MRDRLIEILKKVPRNTRAFYDQSCKVGDKLYEIDLPEYGVIVCKVTKVFYDSRNVVVNVIDGHGKGSEYYFDFDDFGKTVFLTREEAEQALKGGAE